MQLVTKPNCDLVEYVKWIQVVMATKQTPGIVTNDRKISFIDNIAHPRFCLPTTPSIQKVFFKLVGTEACFLPEQT